jgi:hypothetical protein
VLLASDRILRPDLHTAHRVCHSVGHVVSPFCLLQPYVGHGGLVGTPTGRDQTVPERPVRCEARFTRDYDSG